MIRRKKRTGYIVFPFTEKVVSPLYTCPKDAAAIGSGLISAKISETGIPSSVSIDFIAIWVGNGGVSSWQ